MNKLVKKVCVALLMMAVVLMTAQTSQVKAATRARIMISDYTIQNDNVVPGEDTEITFTVKNATASLTATSIFLTFNFEDDVLYPIYGDSNQIYINRLGAGEATEVTMKLKTSPDIETDVVKCIVNVAFSDEETAEVYYPTTLFLPVTEESRLQVANYSVSDKAFVNSKTRISASYSNNGKSEISNVVLHVAGIDGFSEEVYSLGNLSGGETNFGEAYVTFGNTGNQTITVYLSYTDADGKEMKTAAKEYSLEVTKAPSKGNVSDEESSSEQNPAGISTNMIITLVLIVLIVIVGLFVYISWRKRKE